ncbi:MAG TPA: hypothetical protein VFS37_07660 [Conexibacter sp.]|nr:hypothetical protein [Conexibacter sp.]
MKRFIEALVITAAVAGLCATAGAQAASPVVELRGEAWLDRETGPRFHVETSFSTDPPGAELFTVQRAVVYFPDRAGTNGHLFPSCSARQIERFRGNVRRCPKGSLIGRGTVTARALQLGVTATGRVTLFNSHRGKSVTLNIQTLLPAYVNESLDAPLTQLHGIYGEKLTLEVPHSLQEIVSGVFVGVRDFDVTLTGAVRRNGVMVPFLRARRCPRRAIHGVFGFKDWTTSQSATVTADAKVRCTVR